MSDDHSQGNEFQSLSAQIKEAELQVLERQQRVARCADTLVHKAQQHMIAPSNLLLAGGIGFVIGELTKRKSFDSKRSPESVSSATTVNTSEILLNALDFFSTINALYATYRASTKQAETHTSNE